MATDSAAPALVSLSLQPATRRETQLAWAVLGVSALVFVACIPFAKVQLGQVWAFIPIYESALVVNDLITAVLLFGQFSFLRTRALLVLACGYVFTALITVAHALTFPGLFAPAGLIGAGVQSTAWIYMFWHGGFPFAVIAYACLKNRPGEDEKRSKRPWVDVSIGIATAAAIVVGLTLLATAGANLLPPIMRGNQYTPAAYAIVVASTWLCSAVALVVLWRAKPHTVIDLWLMVVLCAWVFDIALAAVFNQGRFDLGFYAGRIYGLLAASFVLWLLLIESAVLYGRLAARTAELVEANKALDAFSYSVSHDLRAPLRAIDGFARMLEEDYSAKLDAEGNRLLAVVRSNAARMDELINDLLEFARVGRTHIGRASVDMLTLAREVVWELDPANTKIEIAELGPALGERALLKQVWTNLIGNAVKYSAKADQPRVEVGTRADGKNNLYWVRDNGAGFDMRYADRLFGVFQRLHSHDDFPGTGVGLAIVHLVVTRHGGRVWAEAEPDEGACFYFTLPARE